LKKKVLSGILPVRDGFDLRLSYCDMKIREGKVAFCMEFGLAVSKKGRGGISIDGGSERAGLRW
jgi:hypothetical protein